MARAALCLVSLILAACGGDPEKEPSVATEPPAPKPPKRPAYWSDVSLHKAIRDANADYNGNGQFFINQQGQPEAIRLAQCGITSIEPLAGMPLKSLDLQGCPVTDISAIKGMPLVELFLDSTSVEDLSPLEGNTTLQKLYADNTNVKDISPIRQAPLQDLNLVRSRVSDISALEAMPLRKLWLTDLAIKDIRPLRKCPLETLTLHRTQVADLKPLEGHPYLLRLHIGETPVKDLTPITSLPLTRLVFTPANIEKGIAELRKMPTLNELAVEFEDDPNTLMAPPVFWPKYDAGELK